MNTSGPICSSEKISGESSSSAYNYYFAENGDTIRICIPRTPTSSSATGLIGEWCWDTNYLYICVSNNTWKRIALTTF